MASMVMIVPLMSTSRKSSGIAVISFDFSAQATCPSDKPNSLALRMATRGAHFAYANATPGVVRLGGPFLNDAGEMAGSLIIIEAADLAAARAQADPTL